MNPKEIFRALQAGELDAETARNRLRTLLATAKTEKATSLNLPGEKKRPVVHWRFVEDGIALVVMEDHASKNTFSEALISGLNKVFKEIAADDQCRVVVLTGFGHYFASGGTQEGLLAIADGQVKFTDINLYTLPLDCSLPVIAAMQGHSIGAGWALGMFADFAVFGRESVYTSNYVQYGFTPGAGATLIFPARFGDALGREILFTGRSYRGLDLEARGIPFPVVPRDEVLPTAFSLARELAASRRDTLIGLKAMLAVPLQERVAATFSRELEMHERTFVNQPEVKERIAARYARSADVLAPAPAQAPRGHQKTLPPVQQTAIAVIGMSGQFPMADDLDTFWANLAEGRDCITEVPDDRWPIDKWFDSDPSKPGKTNSRWMGVVDKAAAFDPLFFNISPFEAEHMDPQQRLFLTNSWRCLEDAGILPSSLSGSRCGVFVGCGPGDYGQFLMERGENAQGFTGAACSILSARIAYHLNLKGPCLAIDTACSSSGVAIAAACDSLMLRNSDLALAGGVCVLSGPSMHVMASKAHMLSTEGLCYTFDDRANGFVPGEGVGVVLLKRLDDALRDRDPVRGIIRAWGVNQDGRTNGITAPSGVSQTQLEREVYDRFGIDPATISLVEAHGTGTKLGDPIEVEALTDSFRAYTDKVGFCALGSVKSNIGHTLTAAGVASVFKVLLALENRALPPSIHVDKVNGHLRIEGSPFYINASLKPWNASGDTHRRAAVSSFGFSGTNVHLVFEEYIPSEEECDRSTSAELSDPVAIVLSAQSEGQLRRYATSLRAFVATSPTTNLIDLAYTLQASRQPMPYRLATIARSRDELLQALDEYVAGTASALWASAKVGQDTAPLGLTNEGQLFNRAIVSWLAGQKTDWEALYVGRRPRRIHLPTYPFAEERYWLPSFRESLGASPVGSIAEAALAPLEAPITGSSKGGDHYAEIVVLLADELSRLLRIPAQRLTPDVAFADIGIDSLLMQQLVKRLGEKFSEIPVAIVFKHKSIGALARYFADHHPSDLVKSSAPPPTKTGRSPENKPPDRSAECPLDPHEAKARREPASSSEDIAVIGLSGRYPKAANLDEFWTNLQFARDCIVEIPKDRWDYRDYGSSSGKSGAMYCTWGGFLPDVDQFDAAFFQISPREAKHMDPQERLFLESAAKCFEDAGYSRQRLRDDRAADGRASVGVFAGVTFNNYQLFQNEAASSGDPTPVNSQLYSVANRVSYVFNLRGPSMCIDTACSSSLLTVHLACESIRRGECEMALAGGVNLSLHPSKYVSLCAAQFASSDGHCRAFGAGGDGYVPGEGVGVALLKSFAQAEADGDHIYGVIKGSAVNNDGRTFGYSVPNPTAQAEVIRQALDNAGIDARTISYVEAHGTGTKLGDPIEISGLTEAYRADTSDQQFCAIGSVKANIGHLEAGAGIAQLTKVLLQLQHKTLVASPVHGDDLNPEIDFTGSPFYVQRVTTDWERPVLRGHVGDNVIPRRAGISSFGAGGVNVHVIVEEYVPVSVSGPEGAPGPVAMILSAKNQDRLKASAKALRTYFVARDVDAEALADVAYTLQTGRDEHAYRLAFIASRQEDVIERLDFFLREEPDGRIYSGHVGAEVLDPVQPDSASGLVELDRVAALWVRGAAVAWSGLNANRRHKVSLPTYPFAGGRYWVGKATSTKAAVNDVRPHGELREGARRLDLDETKAAAVLFPAVTAAEPSRIQPTARHLCPGLRLSLRLARMVEALPIERAEMLAQSMQEQIAELLEYPPGELPELQQGFFDMGMESVMVERFRQALEREFVVELPETAIFDYPTVTLLSEYVHGLVPWLALEDGIDAPDDPMLVDVSSPISSSRLTKPQPEVHELSHLVGELEGLLTQLDRIYG